MYGTYRYVIVNVSTLEEENLSYQQGRIGFGARSLRRKFLFPSCFSRKRGKKVLCNEFLLQKKGRERRRKRKDLVCPKGRGGAGEKLLTQFSRTRRIS